MTITFSSCFYIIKSKFETNTYIEWMNNFISIVNNFNLVIYTDINSSKYIDIKNNPNIKIIIKPLEQFYNYKYKDFWIENHTKNCPKSGATILDDPNSIGFNPQQQAEESNILPGFYIDFYAGMGCYWYARNNNGTLEFFFMHSDSWGQYGEDTSDLPRYNAFRENFELQKIN